MLENGLFAENGTFFEPLGYPLRCFEYLEDCIFFCELRLKYPNYTSETNHYFPVYNKLKDMLITLINNNSGFTRPLVDNHSIPIVQLFLFFSNSKLRQKDIDFLASYICKIIDNILLSKLYKKRFPELYNRISLVSEFIYKEQKPQEYIDTSSILLTILLEFAVIFNAKKWYDIIRTHFNEIMSFQMAIPNLKEVDIEQLLFEKNLHNEFFVESYSNLPENFEDFKKKVTSYSPIVIDYRTDVANLKFLRTLAHSYFKNEVFPNEWRNFISY